MLGDAVPAGTKGTIRFVGPIFLSRGAPWRQVVVDWENGQNKIIVLPFDRFPSPAHPAGRYAKGDAAMTNGSHGGRRRRCRIAALGRRAVLAANFGPDSHFRFDHSLLRTWLLSRRGINFLDSLGGGTLFGLALVFRPRGQDGNRGASVRANVAQRLGSMELIIALITFFSGFQHVDKCWHSLLGPGPELA